MSNKTTINNEEDDTTRKQLVKRVNSAINDFEYLISKCSSGDQRDELYREFEKLALLVDEIVIRFEV